MPVIGIDVGILDRAAKGTFAKAFLPKARQVAYPKVAMIKNSDKLTEIYRHFGAMPQVEEVTDGTLNFKAVKDYSYDLTNKLYKVGIQVKRQTLEFDQTGNTTIMVSGMAAKAAFHPDQLLATTIEGTESAYDGVSLYNSAHPTIGTAIQVNILTSTGNYPTFNLSSSTANQIFHALAMQFAHAKAKMLNLKDDRNTEIIHPHLDPQDLVIVCKPELQYFFQTLFNSPIIQQTSNINTGKYAASWGQVREVVSLPYLTGSIYTWYLFHVGNPARAIIFQRYVPKQSFEDIGRSDMSEVDIEARRALKSFMIETTLKNIGPNAQYHEIVTENHIIAARAVYAMGVGSWYETMKINGT